MSGPNSSHRRLRRHSSLTPATAGVPGRLLGLLLVTLACVASVVPAAQAEPQPPELTGIRVNAWLRPTGSLAIAERRYFGVTDAIAGAEWQHTVPAGCTVQVTGVRGALGPLRVGTSGSADLGTYMVRRTPDRVIVHIYVHLDQRPWQYTVRYRVLGAAGTWSDTGDVLWAFVERLNDRCSGSVTLHLALPSGVRSPVIRVFGPAREADVQTGAGAVDVGLSDLPAGRRLEVGVLFPAAALDVSTRRPGFRLPIVAAQERAWRVELSRLRLRRRGHAAALGAATAAVALLFVVLYVYRGEGYRRRWRDERATTIPVDLPPAVVSYLWNGGRIDDNAVLATVLDLCDRGLLEYAQPDSGPEDATLTLEAAAIRPLPRHEVIFLESLFDLRDVGRPLPVRKLRRNLRAHAKGVRNELIEWGAAVEEAAFEAGLAVRSDWTAQVIASMAAGALIVASVLASLDIGAWALLPILLAVAVFLLAMVVFRHPSRSALDLYRHYKGLRNTLAQMDTMKDRSPESVVLWRQYLVLATVFGLAPQVRERMLLDVPEAFSEPSFAGGYW
jgi:hypothetical protein